MKAKLVSVKDLGRLTVRNPNRLNAAVFLRRSQTGSGFLPLCPLGRTAETARCGFAASDPRPGSRATDCLVTLIDSKSTICRNSHTWLAVRQKSGCAGVKKTASNLTTTG